MPLGTPHNDPDPRDREWLDAIRAGDERAFEEMFRAHYPTLCVYAARLVGQQAAAEELVQDVLLRVWRRREEWEPTGSIGGYLYGAVRNQAISYLRRERVERRWREEAALADVPPALSGHAPRADDDVRAAELNAAIERIIAGLTPRCREAYLLRRQHHLSYAEIARIMDISPKTVEVQIGAALRALRTGLAEWIDP